MHSVRFALVLVIGALIACKSSRQESNGTQSTERATAKPSATAQPLNGPKPDLIVSIKELLKDYEANEVSADNKYKGKLVGLAGIVTEIKKDILDDAYVMLGSGKQFEVPQAQLYFGDESQSVLATLSKGQALAVSCRCQGLMMHVQMRDCRVIRNKDGGILGTK